MATVTKQEVNPTLVPNTTMVLGSVDGEPRAYEITPIDGYVLHDSASDVQDYDPVTGEPIIGTLVFYYASGRATCGANYDFTPLQVTDENGVTFTAYGEQRKFFARPASEVFDGY